MVLPFRPLWCGMKDAAHPGEWTASLARLMYRGTYYSVLVERFLGL